LLALAQPCEAKIVYTPAHRVIRQNSNFGLDLNHDGRTDFRLGFRYKLYTSGTNESIFVSPAPGNEVEGAVGRREEFLAAAFRRGAKIPNRYRFAAAQARMAFFCAGSFCPDASGLYSGNWINVNNRYLGLKFKIHGQTHYGWARLSIQGAYFRFTGTLTGYAYETIPGKAIVAGQTKSPDDIVEGPDAALTAPTREPATLGALALGAPALSIWRREERAS